MTLDLGWMKEHARARRNVWSTAVAVLLLGCFSCAYVLVAPSVFQQDWDSLMYAYWAEVKGIRSIWGNHPLGHVVLFVIVLGVRAFGYVGRILPVYVVVNSVFAGLSVAATYLLLRNVFSIGSYPSLGAALLLGVSSTFWRYVPTADVYSLAILMSVLSWGAVVYAASVPTRRRVVLAGLAAGASALAHQLNGVLLLVTPILLWRRNDGRLARLLSFYTAALVVVAGGLLLFGYLAVESWSLGELVHWARGYVGDPLYGKYLSLDALPRAWSTALQTIVVPTDGRARWIGRGLYAVLLMLMLAGLVGRRQSSPLKRTIVATALAQCFVSWVLIWWFEPFYLKLWLLTLVPFIVAWACLSEGIEHGVPRACPRWPHLHRCGAWIPVALALCVLLFNVRYSRGAAAGQEAIARASLERWLAHSSPEDVLITAGDLVPQLWFWANRPNTLHLYHQLEPSRHARDRFEFLRYRIDRTLCDGHQVLLAPAISTNFHGPFLEWLNIERGELRRFLDSYERDALFSYRYVGDGQETTVYRLRAPFACEH